MTKQNRTLIQKLKPREARAHQGSASPPPPHLPSAEPDSKRKLDDAFPDNPLNQPLHLVARKKRVSNLNIQDVF